jgi:beta-N-acetylhexosaminidase
VISDDLGRAVAVASVPAAQRAVRFVAAGGDLVLTVDPQTAQPMLDGLVARATADPAFATTLNASARRVLDAKHDRGLLRC